jgi:hypothetical protein
MDTTASTDSNLGNENIILTKTVHTLYDVRKVARELWHILDQRAKNMDLDTNHIEPWYRGHAKQNYTLLPSLLRYSHGPEVEVSLLQEYKSKRPPADDWSTLFEMQHYFVPTRLLDWTYLINVALYFATNAGETDAPCIYLLHPCILNARAYCAGMPNEMVSNEKPCFIDPNHPVFLYRNNWLRECKKGRATPLAIIPPSPPEKPESRRLKAQGGRFTLHGASLFPLEKQCPEAFAKIEIRDFNTEHANDYFMTEGINPSDIFPDITGIVMYLIDKFTLKPNPEKRIDVALTNMWEHDHEILLHEHEKQLHIQGIKGCIVNEMYIDRKETDTFRQWLKDETNPFSVITGPAASGKTNFLINAILKDRYYKNHLVLFFSLSSYNPRRHTLMPSIAEFLTSLPSNDVEQINANVLSKMIADGRILLMLDGLDELARNHGEESVKQLDTELNRIGISKKSKIAIACRDHIYERLQRGETLMSGPDCQVIPLDRLAPSDVHEKLESKLEEIRPMDTVLPSGSVAFQIMAEIPLFYGTLSHHLESVAEMLGEISSKSEFWDMWLDLSTRSEIHLESNRDIEEVKRELGEVAIEMLSERTDYLSNEELGDHAAKVKQFASDHCPVFVKEANNKWRFIHQAIREYILASSMETGLENPLKKSVLTHTSSFDYESVEVYRYLIDFLPENSIDSVISKLGKDLNAIKEKNQWNNLIRNYFEAVGMLGTNNEDMRNLAISQALSALIDPLSGPEHRASFLTKFNAARCLSRIHVTSPPVYCEYVGNYSWQKNPDKLLLVFGYAVRGFHRRYHTTGKYPPEVFYISPRSDARQGEVTNHLLNVIEELSKCEELHPNGEFLKINASHALIRWLDLKGSGNNNAERLEKLLYLPKLNNKVKANLVLAVCVNGDITEEYELLLKKSKYPNGKTVDMSKLKDRFGAERVD